jgi:hypothetical protein
VDVSKQKRRMSETVDGSSHHKPDGVGYIRDMLPRVLQCHKHPLFKPRPTGKPIQPIHQWNLSESYNYSSATNDGPPNTKSGEYHKPDGVGYIRDMLPRVLQCHKHPLFKPRPTATDSTGWLVAEGVERVDMSKQKRRMSETVDVDWDSSEY